MKPLMNWCLTAQVGSRLGTHVGTLLVLAALGMGIFGAPNVGQAQTPAATSDAAAAPAGSPRQSLLPLVQPLWSELKPAQQTVLEPFGPQWNALPLEEKHAWVALADRFPKMGAAEQKRATLQIREFAKLTPDQRRLARQNYRLAKSLPKDERVAQSQQYNTMTEEQKKVLQTSGSTSNTAAGHAGARTALAKEASQPLPASGASPRPSGSASPTPRLQGLVPTSN